MAFISLAVLGGRLLMSVHDLCREGIGDAQVQREHPENGRPPLRVVNRNSIVNSVLPLCNAGTPCKADGFCACATWSAPRPSALWQGRLRPDTKERNVPLAPASLSIAQDIPV